MRTEINGKHVDYLIVCKDLDGNIVGTQQFTDFEPARRAFEATMGAIVCFYKELIDIALVDCKDSREDA